MIDTGIGIENEFDSGHGGKWLPLLGGRYSRKVMRRFWVEGILLYGWKGYELLPETSSTVDVNVDLSMFILIPSQKGIKFTSYCFYSIPT